MQSKKIYFAQTVLTIVLSLICLTRVYGLEIAKPFVLKSLDGKEVDLRDFEEKVILLSFWATWCKPCLAEMPKIERIHSRYRNSELVVLGINVDENDKKKAVNHIVKYSF
ncbi:MAG: TlpA disulfide reductase family protein [Candidatus Edwardsbacteria bacterium]